MPRLFVGGALLLVFSLGFVVACDDTPAGPRSGEDVYREVGCVNCHGHDGAGIAGFAPTLHGKKQLWTRENLITYVKDPPAYVAKDPRLREQGRGFRLPMPKLVLDLPIEYENLADYVLSFP